MPKNKGKGGKTFKKGKSKNEGEVNKRELAFKEEDQDYAKVTKLLGGCNVQVQDGKGDIIVAHIRGKFRKKVWIKVGDLVLISLRDFQDGKADVIHLFTPDEARMLKNYGELSDDVGKAVGTTEFNIDDDTPIDFEIDDI